MSAMPSVSEFYGVAAGDAANTDPTPPTREQTHEKGSTGNRFGVLNAFVDHSLCTVVGRSELAVWLALWRATNAETGVAAVSHDYVAERTGCHVSTVKRSIGRLKRAGLVTIAKQGGFRAGVSSYRVRGVGK